MLYKDLHNNVAVSRCIEPVAVGTTGTGQTGQPIDLQGYHGVEFVIGYGAVTATDAVFTVTVLESATATAGDFTSAADADLVGTELAAGLAAVTPRVEGTSEKVFKKVGYHGNLAYAKVKVSSTVTAATPISAAAVRFSPRSAPV